MRQNTYVCKLAQHKSGPIKNSTKHTQETYAKREGRQSLALSPFTTYGLESERVYSLMPVPRTGSQKLEPETTALAAAKSMQLQQEVISITPFPTRHKLRQIQMLDHSQKLIGLFLLP